MCCNQCSGLTINGLYSINIIVLLQIVGNQYDSIVDEVQEEGRIFESFTSLLDNVSPMYRLQFGMVLSDKLKQLTDNQ